MGIKQLLPLLFILVLCGCGKKKLSYEEEAKLEQEQQKLAKKVLTDKLCLSLRDSALFKYIGKGFKIDTNSHKLQKNTYHMCSFFDQAKFEGKVKGVYGKYYYYLDINVVAENPSDWNINSLSIKDSKTKKYVLLIQYGIEQDVEELNESSNAGDSEISTISVNDSDIPAIEDALQKEWNTTNASHPSGAESCNVFKVKIRGTSGNEVTVHYSLRSTFNGEKKFVDLNGTLKKSLDGSWEVVSLGY